MQDIEALKHDKVFAAVQCVGVLDAMMTNNEIPAHHLDAVRQLVADYKLSEHKLAIALDERCKANADRSVLDGWTDYTDHCGMLAAQADARIKWGLTPTDEQLECMINRDAMNRVITANEKAEYLEDR
jgi:hypothetical protein